MQTQDNWEHIHLIEFTLNSPMLSRVFSSDYPNKLAIVITRNCHVISLKLQTTYVALLSRHTLYSNTVIEIFIKFLFLNQLNRYLYMVASKHFCAHDLWNELLILL